MSDDPRSTALRVLRQRLDALRRAGLDRLPVPRVPLSARSPSASSAPEPIEPLRMASGGPPSRPLEAPIPRTPAPLGPAASLFDEIGFEEPAVPTEDRPAALELIRDEVARCTRCAHLAATRTQTVFGVGDPAARLMFIGEAPGADEDRLGEPFVGRAGVLLTDMITKGMGLRREEVYIANILKCRPPNNRDPEPAEVANCIGYLERQLTVIRPEFLCLLGRIAAQTLLATAMPMSRLRGKWHRYRGIPTLVTYHPAYLLRNPAGKADAWEDLKMLMRAMGLKIPERKKPREEH